MTVSSAPGHSRTSSAARPPHVQPGDTPPAKRLTRSRWWDLRFWIGVLLVVASVLVGARLLSAADHTVEIWQVRSDLPAGSPLDPGAFSAVRVHFDDEGAAERYLSADRELPQSAVLGRDVGAGELLPLAAIAEGTDERVLELPLVVPAAGFPSNLHAGDKVDVWAVPAEAGAGDGARSLLDAVRVVAISSADFATATSDRAVVVALPATVKGQRVLDQLLGRTVVLMRVSR